MNKIIPFSMSIVMFLTTWAIMLNVDYIKSKSINLAVAYATISLLIAILVFIILSTIYKYENIHIDKCVLKDEFCIF
jgi:uncharacterized membrane protein YjfL (UPF0719 family)